jgi:hypothetical protein
VRAFKFESFISHRLTPDECRTTAAAVRGHKRGAPVAPFATFFAFVERAIDRGRLMLYSRAEKMEDGRRRRSY